MAKAKISPSEVQKNALPRATDSFDLDLLMVHLAGASIGEISATRFISPGQVDLRIKITLKAITAFLSEKVPERYYQVPVAYKTYWENTIRQYRLLSKLRSPHSQFSVFLIYFKGCTREERIRILSELEGYTYE
jgi:hypothetical protein